MAGSAARCRTPSTNPGVVAGAHRVEAERHRPVQDRGELDLLVAAQARVGRAAGGVLGDEVLDDVLVEPLGHIPDVERDADHIGRPAGVPGVLQRAAAAGAGPVGLRVGGQRQMDAGHLVTRVYRPRRGRGGVHPARHGREYPKTAHRPPGYAACGRQHQRSPPQTGAGSGGAAGAVDDFGDGGGQGVDVGLGGGVAQGEAQGAAGAGVVGADGEQDVAGLGDARGAGRAGGAGDPFASSSMSRASPSQPGKEKCALPGSRAGPGGGAVEQGVGHGGQDLADQVVAQGGDRSASSPGWPRGRAAARRRR